MEAKACGHTVITGIEEDGWFSIQLICFVDEDTDGDGMADWYEWKQFGNLNQVGGDDPDLDGYSLAEEGKFGLSPTVKDEIHEGGVSIRRSRITFLNLSGAKKLIISSNPPGLISGSESYRELNSTYTSQNLTGITDGYVFSTGKSMGYAWQARKDWA